MRAGFERRVTVYLSPEAHAMYLEMLRLFGAKPAAVYERALRWLYHTDPMVCVALGRPMVFVGTPGFDGAPAGPAAPPRAPPPLASALSPFSAPGLRGAMPGSRKPKKAPKGGGA